MQARETCKLKVQGLRMVHAKATQLPVDTVHGSSALSWQMQLAMCVHATWEHDA